MGNSHGKSTYITEEVQLDHFKLLRVIGKGAFGKVRIVERKDTGLTFALKYIRKDEVVRQENVRNIIRERRMLEHLNHPFLCNLRYSFQDLEYLYLVVDLMNGGDLRFHITRKTFTEDAVRFWIAELGCALRYIHKQGIVHRDVKPDNVLLDSEGHVHLADFNVASDWSPTKSLTSRSGTYAYLAPEVYRGKPYKSEVDWWSLGVLFYECIYNKRPFDGKNTEELSNHVKMAKPKYPVTMPPVSTTCTSAIQRLVEKNVHDRIGANGFDNFKNHPFFLPIDFAALERKGILPIFVPPSEKANFDATYDLEELLLEETPLEARTRSKRPRAQLRPDATPQERRADELHTMIEQCFEPFDYTLASFDKFPNSGQSQIRDVTLPIDAITTDIPALETMANTTANTPTSPSPIRTSPHSVTNFTDAGASGLLPICEQAKPGDKLGSQLAGATLKGTNRGVAKGKEKQSLELLEPGDQSQSRPEVQRKPSSFLGVFSKKGRSKSSERERGVLGKEGARVVLSEG